MAHAPLYPVLIAGLHLFLKLDLLTSARVLNIVTHMMLIAVSGFLFYSALNRKRYAFLATLSLVFCVPLLWISSQVLSEIFFTFWIMVFIYLFSRYLEKGDIKNLSAAAVIAALTIFTRYAGVTVIGMGVLLILAARPQDSFKKKISHVFLFGFISSFLMALWYLRNTALASTPSWWIPGDKNPFYENVLQQVQQVLLLFLPGSFFESLSLPAAAILLYLLSLSGLFIFFISWLRRNPSSSEIKIATAGTFTILYLAFLILALEFLRVASLMDKRFLAPAAPCLLLLFFAFLERLPFQKTVFAVAVLWLAFPLFKSVQAVRYQMEEGAGWFNTRHYQESELTVWLKANQNQGKIYSNWPEMIYYFTGQWPDWEPDRRMSLEAFKTKMTTVPGKKYLIWIDKLRPRMYELETVTQALAAENLGSYSLGSHYVLFKEKSLEGIHESI